MIATNELKANWFYSTETKEQFVQKMAKNKSVFIDLDGTARCKYCKAPRMFLLDGVFGGAYCHKYLPIACECKEDKPLKEFNGECPFVKASANK